MRTKKKQAPSPLRFLLGAGVAGYVLFLRPQMIKWSTRLGESQRRLPGDDIIPQPNFQMTQAINIDAPPEALWPWLAQGREAHPAIMAGPAHPTGHSKRPFLRGHRSAHRWREMIVAITSCSWRPNRKLLFGGYSSRPWRHPM